jgi:hypothetical protein
VPLTASSDGWIGYDTGRHSPSVTCVPSGPSSLCRGSGGDREVYDVTWKVTAMGEGDGDTLVRDGRNPASGSAEAAAG